MTTQKLDLTADIIDVRGIIARFEELESAGYGMPISGDEGLKRELADLQAILEELKGNGGDEQWRGDWYPITLIRASYFRDYAQGLAEDIGAVDSGAKWPMNCIDWDQAARELQMDYLAVEIDGVTYFYR